MKKTRHPVAPGDHVQEGVDSLNMVNIIVLFGQHAPTPQPCFFGVLGLEVFEMNASKVMRGLGQNWVHG